jgi:hypothetical protein
VERERDLPDVIRKELGSETSRRFLGRMSAFKPQHTLPDHLIYLLGELDQASHKAASDR